MTRVYQELRSRVMAGDFAPGERIDPARLASPLAASVTPIRDALHRLAGERLVDNWKQEGFHQPIVTEAGLRDLLALSGDLARLILRGDAPVPERDEGDVHDPATTWVALAPVLSRRLAARTSNLELRAAYLGVSDRLQVTRNAEAQVMPDPASDLLAAILASERGERASAQRYAAAHHRRRQVLVPRIAALLRRPADTI